MAQIRQFAVLNYNTSYHTSISCEPGQIFHGRNANNILDSKLRFRRQQQPIPTTQIAHDVLDQVERIHQDVREKATQAYIKYNVYNDKKANASMLKEVDYVYALQPKADHQGSKIPLTELRSLGPYNIEKLLNNNNYLVRKIGTNSTQVLHRMRMRQYTPRQPKVDIRTTPQEYTPDPDVNLKHDDLYARAQECDYEQPLFDAGKIFATPPNSFENLIQIGLSTEEMSNTRNHTRVFPRKFSSNRRIM